MLFNGGGGVAVVDKAKTLGIWSISLVVVAGGGGGGVMKEVFAILKFSVFNVVDLVSSFFSSLFSMEFVHTLLILLFSFISFILKN